MKTKRYECSECGVVGVKLWRQYQTFADRLRLLCKTCAEADQGKPIHDMSDQIGWLVPACPDEKPAADWSFSSRVAWWGYTSVPADVVDWWHSLPPVVVTRSRPASALERRKEE